MSSSREEDKRRSRFKLRNAGSPHDGGASAPHPGSSVGPGIVGPREIEKGEVELPRAGKRLQHSTLEVDEATCPGCPEKWRPEKPLPSESRPGLESDRRHLNVNMLPGKLSHLNSSFLPHCFLPLLLFRSFLLHHPFHDLSPL